MIGRITELYTLIGQAQNEIRSSIHFSQTHGGRGRLSKGTAKQHPLTSRATVSNIHLFIHQLHRMSDLLPPTSSSLSHFQSKEKTHRASSSISLYETQSLHWHQPENAYLKDHLANPVSKNSQDSICRRSPASSSPPYPDSSISEHVPAPPREKQKEGLGIGGVYGSFVAVY